MATKPEKDLSQATVYSAIELSKKTWVVGISTPERDHPSIHRVAGGNFMELVAGYVRRREMIADHRMLRGRIRRLLARAKLTGVGIDCRVSIPPASRSIVAPGASRLTGSMFWRSCVP